MIEAWILFSYHLKTIFGSNKIKKQIRCLHVFFFFYKVTHQQNYLLKYIAIASLFFYSLFLSLFVPFLSLIFLCRLFFLYIFCSSSINSYGQSHYLCPFISLSYFVHFFFLLFSILFFQIFNFLSLYSSHFENNFLYSPEIMLWKYVTQYGR